MSPTGRDGSRIQTYIGESPLGPLPASTTYNSGKSETTEPGGSQSEQRDHTESFKKRDCEHFLTVVLVKAQNTPVQGEAYSPFKAQRGSLAFRGHTVGCGRSRI